MDDFPKFMKHPANRIARSNQATPGVEGYVFDGEDGSQMAFWTCRETAVSAAHAHEYDEYMIVVQGCYTLIINGERIPVNAGGEYFIRRGVPQSGEVLAVGQPEVVLSGLDGASNEFPLGAERKSQPGFRRIIGL
jgi:mannose-6-phosphate isomerase-like protein (cupin superfamily)